jgi:hypothetical protein
MRAESALVPGLPSGPHARDRPGGNEAGTGRRPARLVSTARPARKEGGRSDRDQPHHRHGLGQAGSRSAGQAGHRPHRAGASPARLRGRRPGRAGDRPGRSGRRRPGRLRLHGGSRTTSRSAWGRAARGRAGSEKGRGPSTHEMEGPTRSRSARHGYLMLRSVPLDQPPSRTPARSPSCPVPLAPRGVPPRMVSVFGSERFLRPFDAAAQGVSPTNFKILWPSTNRPQFSQSYPPVDSNSPHEVHREPSAARFGIDPSRLRPGGRGAPAKPIGWRGGANGGWVNGRRANGRPGSRRRVDGAGLTGPG